MVPELLKLVLCRLVAASGERVLITGCTNPAFTCSDSMVSAKIADDNVVASLRRKLVHPETSLSQKYRVLFSLRNIPGAAAEQAIVEGHTHS